MSFYAKEYGFLFESKTEDIPGLGEFENVLAPGAELAKQREALGMTQQQVADLARINIRQYQRLESGERNLCNTSFRIGLSVCYALKIDPMFYCSVVHSETSRQLHEESTDLNFGEDLAPPAKERKFVLAFEKDDGTPGEIIDTENGFSMDAVYDHLCHVIREELSEIPDYRNCNIDIYPYVKEDDGSYSIQAVAVPNYDHSNFLIDFLVLEEDPS